MLVTGGGGFLGSHLVERLRERGDDVVVAAARRLRPDALGRRRAALRVDAQPEIVFHLAAEVGGIGANRANPGRYWFANLMMGAHVLELARLHGVSKLVIAGTVCAYPKFTPTPFHEDDLWNGYPEETNAPYGVAKKSVLVGAQAYRDQYGLDAVFLLPANLYGPRDNFDLETSHVIPALIRKMLEGTERGRALGRRLADPRVPLRRRRGRGVRARRATATPARSRSTSAPEPRSRSASSPETIAELTGFGGRDRLGRVDAERAAAPAARHDDGRGAARLPRHARAPRRARADDRVVPRARHRSLPAASESPPPVAPAPTRVSRGRLACGPDARQARPPRSTAFGRGWCSARSLRRSWLVDACSSRTRAVHNGWLYYNGGDGTWYYTTAWVLGHGQIPFSDDRLRLPDPARADRAPRRRRTCSPGCRTSIVFNAIVLAPIALLCIYGIAKAIGGRRFAYVASAHLGRPAAARDPVLPASTTTGATSARRCRRSLGLTTLGDFPSMVLLLVAAYFAFRAIASGRNDSRRAHGGLAVGLAIAVKPANVIFLPAPVARARRRRRPRGSLLFAAGLAAGARSASRSGSTVGSATSRSFTAARRHSRAGLGSLAAGRRDDRSRQVLPRSAGTRLVAQHRRHSRVHVEPAAARCG